MLVKCKSKPEVLTAAAEANVSTLGLPEVSGKGSSTSEAEDGAVRKPDAAAEVAGREFHAPDDGSQRNPPAEPFHSLRPSVPAPSRRLNRHYSQELVFIQDTGFSVRIQPPGLGTLDIQVSSMELVQIHQLLMYYEDTCHRTSFSLQLDGITLHNFAKIKNIPGLVEDPSSRWSKWHLAWPCAEPYTVREACAHVRNLLRPLDPDDAYNGLDCSSLAFLNVVMQGDDIVGE
ncbi:hypothetical protein HPB52_015375 [Rhipicephalus sanguineus]|uniref:Uncharacterized protein n=1 Tax=Rhipicephalus sanguineus TaxID=34632 RepID=A0A9D4PRV5_RHISA|nr:hypothetical protein HPB52_015375 [Rhipicephalus sanguineus]